MKNVMISLVIIAGCCYSIPGMLHAQTSARANEMVAATSFANATRASVKEMKANLKAEKANLRANNFMAANYPTAQDIRWGIDAESLTSSFKTGAFYSRINFDRNGHWRYTVLNYGADDLASDIRKNVNQAYDGYRITLVQEIHERDVIVYKVHLESIDKIKHVLVNDGNLLEYGSFKKAS